MKTCKEDDCNNPVWARGYCQRHDKVHNSTKYQIKSKSPSKGLKRLAVKKKFPKPTGERDLFLKIWSERPHYCINCKIYLGEDPVVNYFSHIKSKGANPELRLDPNNIELLCIECHHCYEFSGKEKFKARSN